MNYIKALLKATRCQRVMRNGFQNDVTIWFVFSKTFVVVMVMVMTSKKFDKLIA